MSEITPFTFPATGQPVRTVLIDGEPHFVLTDAAKILGYRDAEKAARLLRDSQLNTLPEGIAAELGQRGGRAPKVTTEGGLYRLIMRSNSPLADPFQDWVTDEVLPAIRKTGTYSVSTAVELSRRDLARMVIEEADRADAAEARAAELTAPADAWNTLASATGDYSVRQAAQILDRDPNISTGQNRLFAKLRELGWIDRNGVPYQEQVNIGRLVQRPTSYTHPHNGEPVLSSQVRITVKGIEALRKHLGGDDGGHLFAMGGA